ncbi:MAG: zinc transporter ZntB [Pseudomonadales bacterium]
MTEQQSTCFVCGYVLDGRGGARPVELPLADDGNDAGAQQWLHIDYSFADAEDWLAARGLPDHVIESLVRSDTRPRALAEPGGLLVILRGVNTNPGAVPEDMVSIRIWIEPARIITVRQRRLLSVTDIRERLEQGRGPASAEELLTALIERLADRIADVVEDIEDRVSGYEAEAEGRFGPELRPQLSLTRRQAAGIRRYLAPQREALENLQRYAKDRLADTAVFSIREQSDRITRYVEDLDLARERSLVVQEELMNRIAQEQNERMYVLSIVAAIFLPITFITGIFGMNVAGVPGVEYGPAFWLVAVSMLVISGIIIGLLRLKRWF